MGGKRLCLRRGDKMRRERRGKERKKLVSYKKNYQFSARFVCIKSALIKQQLRWHTTNPAENFSNCSKRTLLKPTKTKTKTTTTTQFGLGLESSTNTVIGSTTRSRRCQIILERRDNCTHLATAATTDETL